MTNNDIFHRIRYALDFRDHELAAIFAEAGSHVTKEQVSGWLKRCETPGFNELGNIELATFLNGLINAKRGKREGPQPEPESELNNNIILRKLRIALNLKAEEMLEVLLLAGMRISKHELSALFRKPGNKHYRECGDQLLRAFLNGMTAPYRPLATAARKHDQSADHS